MQPLPIRLTTPAQVLELIPYLLGFHPTDSLVALGLSGCPPIVSVTVRIDLPPAGPGPVEALAHVTDPVPVLVSGLARAGATSAVLAVFGGPMDPAGHRDQPGTPAAVLVGLSSHALVEHAAAQARAAGIDVVDVLAAGAGHYRSAWCQDLDCCPIEGRLLPGPWQPTEVSAWAVATGLVAARSRDDLSDRLAPVASSQELAAIRRELALQGARGSGAGGGEFPTTSRGSTDRRTGFSPSSTSAVSRVAATVTAGGLPNASDVAAVLLELSEPALRDAALAPLMTRPTADGARRAVRAGLVEVVRRSPPPWRSACAAGLALCCYLDGDGAMADVSARLSLSDDPSCELASLVLAVLAAGIPPATVAASGCPRFLGEPGPLVPAAGMDNDPGTYR